MSRARELSISVLATLALCAPARTAPVAGEESGGAERTDKEPSAGPPAAFAGIASEWHGFARHDFLMDERTLTLQPAGGTGDVEGQRRCIVVAPRVAAPGRPWSWRGCYWDHEPQTEIELLRRGFHIAYITASSSLRPDAKWDAWYKLLTEKYGLSRKPAFIGMSRGGEFALTWATAHPDRVSCIYADNPVANRDILMRLGDLASNDVPLLLVCGSIDPVLGRFALPIESLYQQYGGRVTMMIKEGVGHHPHSLRDPTPLADFITQGVAGSAGSAATAAAPPFVGARSVRTCFYALDPSYRDFPQEGTRVTCRGAWFTQCFDRHVFELDGVEGIIDVLVPQKVAAGTPWVLRLGFAGRDALVDLALLARGFHIVTGPVPHTADGPIRAHWDAVYRHLTGHGFSSTPVMEGAGGAAGEVYAWAEANPDKVSCIYAENPVMRCTMSKTPPLENLAPLARAGVPLFHVCGSLDPWLDAHTRIVEKRYRELGGEISVVIRDGVGHDPPGPGDVKPVVDFIIERTQARSRGSSPHDGPRRPIDR